MTMIDFFTALTEAQDINMYLKPLRYHFEDYEQAEFDESKKLLAPMMNCLCLVWAHSEYYNTPARIIVLLQEICNMIINVVSFFCACFDRLTSKSYIFTRILFGINHGT